MDVVVRDKQGNPVPGLTADDFQIFEDGVRQDVGSLTAVSKPPVTPSGTAPAATVAGASPGEAAGDAAQKAPEVLALVFDRLLRRRPRAGLQRGATSTSATARSRTTSSRSSASTCR